MDSEIERIKNKGLSPEAVPEPKLADPAHLQQLMTAARALKGALPPMSSAAPSAADMGAAAPAAPSSAQHATLSADIQAANAQWAALQAELEQRQD